MQLTMTAGVTSALAACGGGEAGVGSSMVAGGVPLDVYDPIILGGPIADAATINASPWAKRIKDAGVLRRGGSNTGALFSLLDPISNRITGFDAGIGDLLAHYILGGKDVAKLVKFSDTSSDTRETLLQNRTVDIVVATYSITPKRAKKVSFAGPYYSSGTGIAVRKDNTTIHTPSDLDGKKIATESNSTSITSIQEHIKNPKVTLFADDTSCATALAQSRVDAYVLDQAILLSDVVRNPRLKVVGEPFTEDPYGIGVTKDDPSAKAFVNHFLEQIFASGDWEKLWKASVGKYVKKAPPAPPKIGSAPGS